MSSTTFTAREEKPVFGFNASKSCLALLLWDNTDDGFKLKPMLIYHYGNSRALRNYANSTLMCSINGTTRP